jgi:hypothetical protein
VKTRVSLELREQAKHFAFRFACEDCAHFSPESHRCAHGYPPGPRHHAMDEDWVTFCKEFDLAGAP